MDLPVFRTARAAAVLAIPRLTDQHARLAIFAGVFRLSGVVSAEEARGVDMAAHSE